MRKPIVVVSSDEKHLAELSQMLEGQSYRAVISLSSERLKAFPLEHGSQVIILDLDTVPVDNRLCREVKERNPTVHIVAISSEPFHPELKEAIVSHIDVCLSKPTSREELLFWLRSIFQDQPEPETARDEESGAKDTRISRKTNRHSQGDEEMHQ